MSNALKGHPKALYLLFFVEIWERFSYYGMRSILILYLTKSFIEGGLGLDVASASLLYGKFTAGVYLTPLIGGFLADRYLGKRRAIQIGGLLMLLGELCIFSFNTHFGAILGLVCLAMGNGFFKPNVNSLLGEFYDKNDPRKDGAYSIFYMGINIGAFFAPLIIGFSVDYLFAIKNEAGEIITHGYKYGFLISACGMITGQLVFRALMNKFLEDKGIKPVYKIDSKGQSCNNQKLTLSEVKKIVAIAILASMTVMFWVGYEQAGSSLTLYTENYINRNVASFLVPTEWFQSLNPLFIMFLAPILSLFWVSKFGRKISAPKKMSFAIIMLGMSFLFMLGAISQRGGNIADISIKASTIWIVMLYLFQTIGELCLEPVGLSVVSKLSPARFVSLMMGIWYLASFVANYLSGLVASFVETIGALEVFTWLAFGSMALGFVLFLCSPFVENLMQDVK